MVVETTLKYEYSSGDQGSIAPVTPDEIDALDPEELTGQAQAT